MIWQNSAFKSHSLQNTHKHTSLPPSAKRGQLQNVPVRDTVFQKNRSPWLSIPHHSSAFRYPPLIRAWLDRSRDFQHHQPYPRVLQLFIQNHVAPPYTPDLMAGWWGPSAPFQTAWQRESLMAATPNLNLGLELLAWPCFWLLPWWITHSLYSSLSFSCHVQSRQAWPGDLTCLPASLCKHCKPSPHTTSQSQAHLPGLSGSTALYHTKPAKLP